MSQENVEVVRGYVETFSSADLTPSDWSRFVADFLDPDADYYPARKFPEARPCHGVEEILRFRADYRDAWDGFEVVVKKMIPVGDDRVLVHSTIRAEGRESGATLDGDFYMCMLPMRGSPDPAGRPSRARTEWREPRSGRAAGLGDIAGEQRGRPRECAVVSREARAPWWRRALPTGFTTAGGLVIELDDRTEVRRRESLRRRAGIGLGRVVLGHDVRVLDSDQVAGAVIELGGHQEIALTPEASHTG
jgi:hypothetical protein